MCFACNNGRQLITTGSRQLLESLLTTTDERFVNRQHGQNAINELLYVTRNSDSLATPMGACRGLQLDRYTMSEPQMDEPGS